MVLFSGFLKYVSISKQTDSSVSGLYPQCIVFLCHSWADPHCWDTSSEALFIQLAALALDDMKRLGMRQQESSTLLERRNLFLWAVALCDKMCSTLLVARKVLSIYTSPAACRSLAKLSCKVSIAVFACSCALSVDNKNIPNFLMAGQNHCFHW